MNSTPFELDTPHGQMKAQMLVGITQSERDLISERVKSGLAAAKAPGEEARLPARTAARIGQARTEGH